jgi:hypothetical protein
MVNFTECFFTVKYVFSDVFEDFGTFSSVQVER